MTRSGQLGAAALTVAALCLTSALAFDDAQYPDLKGQWIRVSPPGQPASSCHTFCPGGIVRAAVALQSRSVCARAAPAEQTKAATVSSRTPANPRLPIYADLRGRLARRTIANASRKDRTLRPLPSMRNPARAAQNFWRTAHDP